MRRIDIAQVKEEKTAGGERRRKRGNRRGRKGMPIQKDAEAYLDLLSERIRSGESRAAR